MMEHEVGKDGGRAARGILLREDIESIEFLKTDMNYVYDKIDTLKKSATKWTFNPSKVSHYVLSQLEPGSVYVKVKVKDNSIIPVTNVYSPYFGGKDAEGPNAFQYEKIQSP